jgi:hypothetical protein
MEFENLKVGNRIQWDVGDVVQSLAPEQIRPVAGFLKGWSLEVARVFIEGGAVRFRDDQGGEPSATDGDVLNDGDYWNLVGESISNFKVISQTGTVKGKYYTIL